MVPLDFLVPNFGRSKCLFLWPEEEFDVLGSWIDEDEELEAVES